jgi:hypothetical protein
MPDREEFLKLMIIDDIEEKIKFSPEERALANLRTEDKNLLWNDEKVPEKEVAFTEIENSYIKEVFQKLNDEKQLQRYMRNTYKKFHSYANS